MLGQPGGCWQGKSGWPDKGIKLHDIKIIADLDTGARFAPAAVAQQYKPQRKFGRHRLSVKLTNLTICADPDQPCAMRIKYRHIVQVSDCCEMMALHGCYGIAAASQ